MFRAAHPRDIGGLLGLASRSTADHAYPHKRIGHRLEADRSVARVVGGASLPRRGITHAFALTRGQSSGGLAVIRSYEGVSSWEIEHLLAPPDGGGLCSELLGQVNRMLAPRRGTSIFLRLLESSPIIRGVAEAGFRSYGYEELYVGEADALRPRVASPNITINSWRGQAAFQLFRLYTAWTPVTIRAADGLTFREWQNSLSTRWVDVRNTTDIVASKGDQPVGWARMGESTSRALLARTITAEGQPDAQEALIDAVLEASGGKRVVHFLAPSYQAGAGRALMERGFRSEAMFQDFVCQVGERVMEGALAPVGL